jgi:hypothetical protein
MVQSIALGNKRHFLGVSTDSLVMETACSPEGRDRDSPALNLNLSSSGLFLH